jgi:hypothetical protein
MLMPCIMMFFQICFWCHFVMTTELVCCSWNQVSCFPPLLRVFCLQHCLNLYFCICIYSSCCFSLPLVGVILYYTLCIIFFLLARLWT